MKNQFLINLFVLLVFISCDNTRSRKDAHEESAVHPEIDI
jgi:hypothetical protein